MAHISAAYYIDEYIGESAGDQFPRYAARASDDIDLTVGEPLSIEALPEAQQRLVKKATAAQVEWYVINGDTYNEATSGVESIGSFSRSQGGPIKPPAALCSRARAYLEQTVLMFRGVEVFRNQSGGSNE
jgi:hypothetical protein